MTQVIETTRIDFTAEQVKLIKEQIAPKATDSELKLFLYQAKRTGLDPLTRQLYCIHRGNKMTIQTSIDGFRVIAERSGDYGGQDEPIFTEQDGKLVSCKITVYRFRGDVRYPAAVGVAYWNEYKPQSGMDSMWLKMPHTMLSKVAEALALRKAYPQDLSGLYTTEEMSQADKPETIDVAHAEIDEDYHEISIGVASVGDLKQLEDYWNQLLEGAPETLKRKDIVKLFKGRKEQLNAV